MTSPLGLLSGSLGSAPAASATGSTVAQSDRAGLSRVATDLALDASVVIAFGGANGSALTYNAAGLLNTLAQAGTVPQPLEIPENGADTDSLVRQAAEQAIAGTLPASPTAAGVYTATGTFQGLSDTALSASWAAILESHPELAGTVVASSLARGITRTLIASA